MSVSMTLKVDFRLRWPLENKRQETIERDWCATVAAHQSLRALVEGA